ncbi:hypothetical protein [Ramlibacter rhizophilus]|uniref:Glycosyltransferase RgtA/B/C/D-like domain-containing protein n=1 Tax=Ramlibacter rhizophilus TaxID=1781167 RepID=A0A4Z0BIM6_9BURK|nr:hypothetical protein [Ramlibacter rhizophilus]TFY98581.1 hypothetical protein EZ242_13680 [Ramlibacter rhizophilus]
MTSAPDGAPRRSDRLARAFARLALLVTAALLCVPAVLNGQPFLYPDTPVYVRRAEVGLAKVLGAERIKPWSIESRAAAGPAPAGDATPAGAATPVEEDRSVNLAGRSVYYGALLYGAYAAGSLWLAVVAQALCVAALLYLLIVRLWGFGGIALLAAGAGLALLTPLGAFTGLLMPDLFAGLTVLCSGVLAAYWHRLRRWERIGVAALLLFAIAAHPSHLALAAAIVLVVLGLRLLRVGLRTPGPAIVLLGACVLGGLAAEWVFNKAMTVAVGAPPVRLPHTMAHLVEMGPGTAYLRQNCPQAGYQVCDYVANFPTHWDDFLFSTEPGKGAFWLADARAKRRMGEEQFAFALDVLRFDPVGVVRGLASDVLVQLGTFKVDIGHYGPNATDRFYAGHVPQEVLADMRRTRGVQGGDFDGWLSGATYATVAASLLLLAWRRQGARLARPPGFDGLLLVVGAGVVANAVICAVFAAPLDRFQSRVVWLVPLLALGVVLQMARSRTQGPLAQPA